MVALLSKNIFFKICLLKFTYHWWGSKKHKLGVNIFWHSVIRYLQPRALKWISGRAPYFKSIQKVARELIGTGAVKRMNMVINVVHAFNVHFFHTFVVVFFRAPSEFIRCRACCFRSTRQARHWSQHCRPGLPIIPTRARYGTLAGLFGGT